MPRRRWPPAASAASSSWSRATPTAPATRSTTRSSARSGPTSSSRSWWRAASPPATSRPWAWARSAPWSSPTTPRPSAPRTAATRSRSRSRMPSMKGSAFTARFAYLKRSFPARWDALLDAFEPATAALAHGPCLKGSWYPFACFVDLNVKADRMLGRGDLALARVLGREAARVNLPTLYKLFYKVGSPEFIFTRAGSLWRQHHDSGRVEVIWISEHEADWRTHEFAAPHPALCRSLEGFITGTFEMMGMTDVQVREDACVLHGGAYCSLHGT